MDFNQLVAELYQRLGLSEPDFESASEAKGLQGPWVALTIGDLVDELYIYKIGFGSNDACLAIRTELLSLPIRETEKIQLMAAALKLTCVGAYFDRSILYHDPDSGKLNLYKQIHLKTTTVSKLEVELEKFCNQADFYIKELEQLAF